MNEKLQYIQHLRSELKNAYRFKNFEAMWNITNRLLTVYAELADALLEEHSNADSGDTTSPSVTADIEVTDNTAMYFNCPRGLPRGY